MKRLQELNEAIDKRDLTEGYGRMLYANIQYVLSVSILELVWEKNFKRCLKKSSDPNMSQGHAKNENGGDGNRKPLPKQRDRLLFCLVIRGSYLRSTEMLIIRPLKSIHYSPADLDNILQTPVKKCVFFIYFHC